MKKQEVQKYKGDNNDFITAIKQAEELAEYVINSDTFGANFAKKDKEGNITKNKNDVISCIMLGNELGLKPMEAITLGNKLNPNSYLCVKRGEMLGLNASVALCNIYPIETQAGITVYTGIHIIVGAMNTNGVEYEVLEDAEPVYKYTDAAGKVEYEDIDVLNKDGSIKSNLYLVTSLTTATDMKAALEKKLILVRRKKYTVRTKVRFIKDNRKLTISYTLQQATDAGLYKGFHSEDVDEKGNAIWVKGKSNWNNHPETHLRNRVLSIGGRIIIGDILQGMYTRDEVEDFVDDPSKLETVDTEATIVEDETTNIEHKPDDDNDE